MLLSSGLLDFFLLEYLEGSIKTTVYDVDDSKNTETQNTKKFKN